MPCSFPTVGVSSFQVQADTAQLGLANNIDKELEATVSQSPLVHLV